MAVEEGVFAGISSGGSLEVALRISRRSSGLRISTA